MPMNTKQKLLVQRTIDDPRYFIVDSEFNCVFRSPYREGCENWADENITDYGSLYCYKYMEFDEPMSEVALVFEQQQVVIRMQ